MRLLACAAAAALIGCGGGEGGAVGGAWVAQDVPKPPGNLAAYALWVQGDADVWIGSTSLWHFNGSTWTETPPPVQTGIVDIFGFAANDVWAIGDAAVLHWDGTTWTAIPETAGVPYESLWRMWGASSRDLYIANTDNSRVYHYDGTAWTRTTLQFVAASAIWGSGPDDIWLTSVSNAYHYSGGQWQLATGAIGGTGISGTGPNDVWIVGGFEELTHWDGTAWTPVDMDRVPLELESTWAAASGDVWAVGLSGNVAHLDGTDWSYEKMLDGSQNFTSVRGSSPGNVWAAALDIGAQQALVLHYEP